ncbi:uncharacterized protein Dvir_GJ19574, partial [Drosophila virilis]
LAEVLGRQQPQPTGSPDDDEQQQQQRQQPAPTAQTVQPWQKQQQPIQLLDTQQLPANQQQQQKLSTATHMLKRKRRVSQPIQRSNITCNESDNQQNYTVVKRIASEPERAPKRLCWHLALSQDQHPTHQRRQSSKRHTMAPAHTDSPSPKRSRLQNQLQAKKSTGTLICYNCGKWGPAPVQNLEGARHISGCRAHKAAGSARQTTTWAPHDPIHRLQGNSQAASAPQSDFTYPILAYPAA